MSRVVAIVLAAGGGSRFTGPSHKLLAELPETAGRPAETVLARSMATALAAEIGPVVVVSGAIDAETVRSEAEADGPGGELIIVQNPRWSEGQMTSVQLALDEARELGAERVVIGLGDQPGVDAEAWRAVASAEGSIAVATYDGRRGNPVALRSDIWDLLPVEGDEGARSVMRLHPELVVAVPCSGSPDDIDTTEDLRRWQNNSSTNSP